MADTFFARNGFLSGLVSRDLGWSGAGTCPSPVGKFPREAARSLHEWWLMLESPGWIRDRGSFWAFPRQFPTSLELSLRCNSFTS